MSAHRPMETPAIPPTRPPVARGPPPAARARPSVFGLASRVFAAVVVIALVLTALIFGGRAMGFSWGDRDPFSISNQTMVRAGGDDSIYRVHAAHQNPQGAAEAMAELNARGIALLRRLRDRYGRGGAGAREMATRRLLARYNPDNLAENSPNDPTGDTSYTVDKGSFLALCLREKNPRASGDPGVHDFHDYETLTFVLLHELAHVAVDRVGPEGDDHPLIFWKTFKFLLLEAGHADIIQGVDYGAYPRMYCGIPIDYNPLYDPALLSI